MRFAVEVPSAGTYALFFDFLHDGQVRTARFVVEADTTTTTPHASPPPLTTTASSIWPSAG